LKKLFLTVLLSFFTINGQCIKQPHLEPHKVVELFQLFNESQMIMKKRFEDMVKTLLPPPEAIKGNAQLQQENDQLRAQIAELTLEVTRLKATSKKKPRSRLLPLPPIITSSMPVKKHPPACLSPTISDVCKPPTGLSFDPPMLKPPPLEKVDENETADETDASSVTSTGSRSSPGRRPAMKRKRRDSLRLLGEKTAPSRKRRQKLGVATVTHLSPRLLSPQSSISNEEAFSRVSEAVRGVHGALFTVDDVVPYILSTYPRWKSPTTISPEIARVMSQMKDRGRLVEVRTGNVHVDGHQHVYYRLPTAEELSGAAPKSSGQDQETLNPFERVSEAVRGVSSATFTVDDILPYISETYPGWKCATKLSHVMAHMSSRGRLIAVGTGRPDSDGHNEIIYRLPTTEEKKFLY